MSGESENQTSFFSNLECLLPDRQKQALGTHVLPGDGTLQGMLGEGACVGETGFQILTHISLFSLKAWVCCSVAKPCLTLWLPMD